MPDVKHFDADVVLGRVVPLVWQRGWARTAVQEIVTATGVSRSSLYATFGTKNELFLSALRRYLAEHVDPAFRELERDERGLPALAGFFGGLITARCCGPWARWGCLATNLQVSADVDDCDVQVVLAEHQQRLHAAMRAALAAAAEAGQLRPDVALDGSAEQLALLAQGVNLRSRAGADPASLRAGVTAALQALRHPASAVDVRLC